MTEQNDTITKVLFIGFIASLVANLVVWAMQSNMAGAKPQGDNAVGFSPSNTHPHGEHICYCPGCGYEAVVGEGVRCQAQTCPVCGTQMRARNTGELRPIRWLSREV